MRVGLKQKESPIARCYCFGYTAEAVREEIVAQGRSTAAETITAEVQARNCSCEVKNPSGKCCLGEVYEAIQQIQKELSREEGSVSLELKIQGTSSSRSERTRRCGDVGLSRGAWLRTRCSR